MRARGVGGAGAGEVKRYDLGILEKPFVEGVTFREANWQVDVTSYVRDGGNKQNAKSFFINVCGPLANMGTLVGNHTDAAIVEENLEDYSHGVHTLGSVKDAHLYSLKDDDLRMSLPNGESSPWDPDCQERKSTIFFICEDVGLGHPVFAEETSKCNYLFIWVTCAACPLGSKARDLCSASSFGAAHGLSPGPDPFKVFTFAIVALVLVYAVGGVMYMRLVHKAKGIDQIPNASFWMACCAMPFALCGYVTKPRTIKMSNVSFHTQSGLLDLDDDCDDDADEN